MYMMANMNDGLFKIFVFNLAAAFSFLLFCFILVSNKPFYMVKMTVLP